MKYTTSTLSKTINAVFITSLFAPFLVNADTFGYPEFKVSQSDFGGTGLMQVPTGRMAPEGDFNLGGTFNNEYHHGTVSLQLLPWLETTIRYTMVQDLLYSSNSEFSGDTEYTDKGIDFKVRLWEESYWLPETSVGIRDFGGTGLFDGEYAVATKRFGNVDLTLGMGWGYLGTRGNLTNPFCKATDSYCVRDESFQDNGGSVDYQRWFKGPSAIIGGIEYQTPYDPLRLKVEYEGNDYSNDFPVVEAKTDMTQHTPWNFGVVYSPANWADIRISYERGDTLTLGITAKSNFNTLSSVWRDSKKPAYTPRASSANPDWDKVAKQISDNAGYQENEITLDNDTIIVKGEPEKYRDIELGHERTALILSKNRPEFVDTYTFVESNYDFELRKTSYDADKFDDVAGHNYIGAELADARIDEPETNASQNTDGGILLASSKDNLSYGVAPTLSQSFGGAEGFYLYAFGITGSAGYRLTDSLELSGSLYVNLFDNYDKFNYIEDSPHINNFSTPRVRTLFRYYVTENSVRMNNLQLTWFEQLSDSFYMQTYGGYLESMFAGVGGEVLYRQKDSNWALGLDANYVTQRDPADWFSLYSEDYFEYDGGCENGELTTDCAAYVLVGGKTGFVNFYYMPPGETFKNTRFKVSVGQFLGQDKGARIDFSKQFDSGVITGAYASFSDLTADEYGEGSFTKGFYISFPLDIMTIKPSRNRAAFYWQPLTRDGGQMLSRKYELFNETDARSPWFTKK